MLFLAVGAGAQSWTLDSCINYALSHNIQLAQSRLSHDISLVDKQSAQLSVLPTLNGFASNSFSFGQTVDPFTNQFASNRVRSNSFSLNSSVTLFSGLQQYYNVRMLVKEEMAARFDADAVADDITLQVAGAYLQVLYDEDLLHVADDQVRLSTMQVVRMQKMLDAGAVSEGNLLEIKAQLAADRLQQTGAANALDIARLNLQQLLQLEPDPSFAVAPVAVDLTGAALVDGTPGQIYNAAVSNLPQAKAAELRLSGASDALAMARGSRYPRLSVSANYGTGFSEASKELTDLTVSGYDTIGITTNSVSVLAPAYDYSYRVTPFRDQLDNNLNYSISLSLTVPIFNGWSAQTGIAKAKIGLEQAQLNDLAVQQQIRQTVEQAYADAMAALKKYNATKATVGAQETAFAYTKKRFEVGVINAVDFNLAKNNLARAQSDLLQAKYDFVFKTRVLAFYQGKPLGL